MYARFSISDPELKPRDDKKYLARDAPSLRWVKMVVHRDGCVRRLLTYMALDGHRVPRRTARVLHKYWLLVELKSSEAREKYIRDREYWSDTDILVFHLFLTKLDMHFSDPVHGQGVCALSELLLTQPTLTYLCNLVAGRAKVNYDHLADMVTWTYPNEDLDIEQHPWLDDELTVQPDRWGILTSENWEVGGEYMATPLDLLALEAIRRRIPVNRFEIDFVVYGYTDPETGANLPFPRLRVERGRRVVGMLEVEEEVDEDGKSKFEERVEDHLLGGDEC